MKDMTRAWEMANGLKSEYFPSPKEKEQLRESLAFFNELRLTRISITDYFSEYLKWTRKTSWYTFEPTMVSAANVYNKVKAAQRPESAPVNDFLDLRKEMISIAKESGHDDVAKQLEGADLPTDTLPDPGNTEDLL
jgi:hypothetical protein